MSKNDKTQLTEDQLISTTGGAVLKECGFVHASGETKVRVRADGKYESNCGSICMTAKYTCACRDSGNCRNRWHLVTENGSPLPNDVNHRHWYN